jgi:putative component of membrane protein insertase Oxa1/YidC/SpoIIIJ protein YidD
VVIARPWLLLIVSTILLLTVGPARADEQGALEFLGAHLSPRASDVARRKPTDWDQVNEAKLALTALVALYQRLLSSQDGARCPFHLSCSQYMKLAVERYGPVRGIVLAADRLQRCHGMGESYYGRDPSTGKLDDPLP